MQGCLVRPDQVWAHGAAREPEEDIVRSNCLLSRNLVTIARRIRPDVGVIDGVVAMEGEGPGGGERVDLGVVVAGSDFVSADAVMAEIMGFDSRKIGYLWYADKVGLGVGRLEEIKVVGRRIEEVRRTFKRHSNYYREQVGWREYAGMPSGVPAFPVAS